MSVKKVITLLSAACLGFLPIQFSLAQETEVLVQVRQVRDNPVQRSLALSGRVYSRNDASISLTLAGELEWVLEAGTHVAVGEVIARLDQKPILLRRNELQHLAERERVNSEYLDKDLARLRSLQKSNNASTRQVDEGASKRDISRLIMRSIQAKIDQLDDELRRSQLVAPFAGVIAQRNRRGGEYAQIGEVIVRLVDLNTLELRFQVPVVYMGRVAAGNSVIFKAQSRQGLEVLARDNSARVRSVIPAANPSSQTFGVLADIGSTSLSEVIAGQLVNISVPISANKTSLQIPRDAIVLRADGNFIFRISKDNRAHKVAIDVGEGSREWVSVKGELNEGDWVAIRGLERLQDGQKVKRIDS